MRKFVIELDSPNHLSKRGDIRGTLKDEKDITDIVEGPPEFVRKVLLQSLRTQMEEYVFQD